MQAQAALLWSTQYEAVKRGVVNRRQSGIPLTQSEVRSHQDKITNLTSALRPMVASPDDYGLAASECARREFLLEGLRSLLVAAPSLTSSAGGGGTMYSQRPSSSLIPVQISNAGLSVQREEALKEQDSILEDISSGVDRLFRRALVIGDEAAAHTRLLDAMDDNVDTTQRALKEEAKHAAEVREKSRSFYLYLCIAFEVLVILLLTVIYFIK